MKTTNIQMAKLKTQEMHNINKTLISQYFAQKNYLANIYAK